MKTENTNERVPEPKRAAPDLGALVRETVERLGRGLEIMRGEDRQNDSGI